MFHTPAHLTFKTSSIHHSSKPCQSTSYFSPTKIATTRTKMQRISSRRAISSWRKFRTPQLGRELSSAGQICYTSQSFAFINPALSHRAQFKLSQPRCTHTHQSSALGLRNSSKTCQFLVFFDIKAVRIAFISLMLLTRNFAPSFSINLRKKHCRFREFHINIRHNQLIHVVQCRRI